MKETPSVFVLPGWQDSGPAHWQSLWEQSHGYERVQQHEWMRPLRGDWVARLEEVLLDRALPAGGAVLVAHSLGCLLTAAWAALSRNTDRVKAAFLVAPGDPDNEAVRHALASWLPVVLERLPFPSVLLGSRNDPYCSFERARGFARAWGSEFVDYGLRGHINADSGLGDWPEGHGRLLQLCALPSAARA